MGFKSRVKLFLEMREGNEGSGGREGGIVHKVLCFVSSVLHFPTCSHLGQVF